MGHNQHSHDSTSALHSPPLLDLFILTSILEWPITDGQVQNGCTWKKKVDLYFILDTRLKNIGTCILSVLSINSTNLVRILVSDIVMGPYFGYEWNMHYMSLSDICCRLKSIVTRTQEMEYLPLRLTSTHVSATLHRNREHIPSVYSDNIHILDSRPNTWYHIFEV